LGQARRLDKGVDLQGSVTEVGMAAEGELQSELKAHERGYSLFTAIMKWGAIISFIVTMLVVFMISS
jgi:hypothetical protein